MSFVSPIRLEGSWGQESCGRFLVAPSPPWGTSQYYALQYLLNWMTCVGRWDASSMWCEVLLKTFYHKVPASGHSFSVPAWWPTTSIYPFNPGILQPLSPCPSALEKSPPSLIVWHQWLKTVARTTSDAKPRLTPLIFICPPDNCTCVSLRHPGLTSQKPDSLLSPSLLLFMCPPSPRWPHHPPSHPSWKSETLPWDLVCPHFLHPVNYQALPNVTLFLASSQCLSWGLHHPWITVATFYFVSLTLVSCPSNPSRMITLPSWNILQLSVGYRVRSRILSLVYKAHGAQSLSQLPLLCVSQLSLNTAATQNGLCYLPTPHPDTILFLPFAPNVCLGSNALTPFLCASIHPLKLDSGGPPPGSKAFSETWFPHFGSPHAAKQYRIQITGFTQNVVFYLFMVFFLSCIGLPSWLRALWGQGSYFMHL